MRGSVKKEGSSWMFVVDHGVDPATGKRRQVKRRGFRTRKDAEAALNETLKTAADGGPLTPARMTVARFLLGEWLPAVRATLAPTTRATYTVVAEKYIAPRIGALPLGGVTPAVLNKLYGQLLESGGRGGAPLAAKTVRHSHTVLHKAFADAVKWGVIARNPAEATDPPAVGDRAMHVWSPAQLRRFLGHVADDRLAPCGCCSSRRGCGVPRSSDCHGRRSISRRAGSQSRRPQSSPAGSS